MPPPQLLDKSHEKLVEVSAAETRGPQVQAGQGLLHLAICLAISTKVELAQERGHESLCFSEFKRSNLEKLLKSHSPRAESSDAVYPPSVEFYTKDDSNGVLVTGSLPVYVLSHVVVSVV
ncbi:hypothetical protein CB1_001399003 [Camelus ferus]|nr:hypothetical protein CB1_001399003 [Camelus ferus]